MIPVYCTTLVHVFLADNSLFSFSSSLSLFVLFRKFISFCYKDLVWVIIHQCLIQIDSSEPHNQMEANWHLKQCHQFPLVSCQHCSVSRHLMSNSDIYRILVGLSCYSMSCHGHLLCVVLYLCLLIMVNRYLKVFLFVC